MKKLMTLLLAAFLMMSLAACGGGGGGATGSKDLPGYDLTTDPVVLYDQDGITFSIAPMTMDEWGEEHIVPFTLACADTCTRTVGIDFGVRTFNDYEVSRTSVMAPVEPGETYTVDNRCEGYLKKLGMEEMTNYSFYDAYLYDYETDEKLYEFGPVILRGTAYGTEIPDYEEDEALLLYSDDTVQFFLCPDLIVNTEWNYISVDTFLKNSSENLMWGCSSNMMVNGVTLPNRENTYVSAGCRSISTIVDGLHFKDFGVESADQIETIEFDYEVSQQHGDTLANLHIVLKNAGGVLTIESAEPVAEEAAA